VFRNSRGPFTMPHCLCVKPHDDAIYPADPKCSQVQCPNATESGEGAGPGAFSELEWVSGLVSA
jgi:hypothetical protein